MRTVLVAVVLLAAVPAFAQEGVLLLPSNAASPATCDRPSLEGLVSIDHAGGSTSKGILYCVSADELVLLRDGALQRTPLTDVIRIKRPADPVWDGAAIGAGIAFAMFATWADSGLIVRQAAVFAMIGGTVDALRSDARTLWAAAKPKRAALHLTVRF
jgi:hypothetical protein